MSRPSYEKVALKPHHVPSFPAGLHDSIGPAIVHPVGVKDVLRFFRQNWLTISTLAALSVLTAVMYTSLAPPTFKATASVMFDPNVSSALLKDERWQAVETSARIDSQVEIIKSGRVATAVVQALSLDADEDFVGAAQSVLSPAAWLSPTPNSSVEKAVVSLTNRLSVRRIGQSTALEITFASGSAEKSARVANAVAQAYIDVALLDKSAIAQNGAKWLEKRLDYLRGQAYSALQEAENFKATGQGSAIESRVKLAELQSVAQSYRQMYDTFLLKYFETEQLVSYPVADVKPLSSATAGLADKSPKKAAIILFAAFAGAFSGVGLALMRQALNHTVRNQGSLLVDPRAIYLGNVEHVGKFKVTLPADRSKGYLRWLRSLVQLWQSRPAREDFHLSNLMEFPPPAMKENLRRIRTSLFAALPLTQPRVIGVTSVGRGEGKTAVAVNLASVCRASGYRTLLIDACSDNPSASRLLAPDVMFGFHDAIGSDQSLHRFIVNHPSIGISFLPIGKPTAPQTLGDFLDGPARGAGMEQLRSEFDVVIIDLPALSLSSDAVSASALMDGILVVAEAGKTRSDDLSEELGRLPGAPELLVGCVLNKTIPDFDKDV